MYILRRLSLPHKHWHSSCLFLTLAEWGLVLSSVLLSLVILVFPHVLGFRAQVTEWRMSGVHSTSHNLLAHWCCTDGHIIVLICVDTYFISICTCRSISFCISFVVTTDQSRWLLVCSRFLPSGYFCQGPYASRLLCRDQQLFYLMMQIRLWKDDWLMVCLRKNTVV